MKVQPCAHMQLDKRFLKIGMLVMSWWTWLSCRNLQWFGIPSIWCRQDLKSIYHLCYPLNSPQWTTCPRKENNRRVSRPAAKNAINQLMPTLKNGDLVILHVYNFAPKIGWSLIEVLKRPINWRKIIGIGITSLITFCRNFAWALRAIATRLLFPCPIHCTETYWHSTQEVINCLVVTAILCLHWGHSLPFNLCLRSFAPSTVTHLFSWKWVLEQREPWRHKEFVASNHRCNTMSNRIDTRIVQPKLFAVIDEIIVWLKHKMLFVQTWFGAPWPFHRERFEWSLQRYKLHIWPQARTGSRC